MNASTAMLSLLGPLTLLAGSAVVAADRDWPENTWSGMGWPTGSVPENARVRVSTERDEYFLGENVLVHFKVENTGGPPFQASFGGDYRGAPRALRFQVIATDEDRNRLVDPYPKPQCMGGLGGPLDVTVDKPCYASVELIRYVRFEKPGTYRIRIRHDCGWQATDDNPLPEAQITLRFKRPTDEEARELVRSWLARPEYGGTSFGSKSEPHPDFSHIRFAEYLPPLAEAARQGNVHAIKGVGSIASPEATRVLIELAGQFDEEVSVPASRELVRRLPFPVASDQHDDPSQTQAIEESEAARLIRNGWRDEFAPEIRTVAAELLKSYNWELVRLGAKVIERVGQPDDMPHVVTSLDRVLPLIIGLKSRSHDHYRVRNCGSSLGRACVRLLARGAEVPTQPASPGEAILFLTAIKDESFRPAGWIETCARLLQSDIPYVQEQVLESLPAPLPTALHEHLPGIIRSRDVDAAAAACRVVGRDRLTQFRRSILSRLRRAKEDWLFSAASDAAVELGVDYERIEILVDRLDDRDMLFKCLDELKTIFANAGGGGHSSNMDVAAAARRIKPKWEALLAEHGEYLQAGGTFTLPDPRITQDMFPEGYTITLQSGPVRTWPVWNSGK